MQTVKEMAAVKAFYYSKIAEGLSLFEANKLIEYSSGVGWSIVGSRIPPFLKGVEYRIKPETVTHPGGEYPKPCDDAAEIEAQGFAYYSTWSIGSDGAPIPMASKNSVSKAQEIANSGMYHLTEEDALEHAKVMLGLK